MENLPKRDQSIIIKINGEEKEYKEEKIPIYNWQDAREELAAGLEKESYEENEWTERESWTPRPTPKAKIKTGFTSKKRKKTNLSSSYTKTKLNQNHPPLVAIISLVSAIILGVTIGILLLQVMLKEPSTQPTIGKPQEETSKPVHNGVQMVLEKQKFYFLQQGVYKNEKSVEEVVSQYTAQKIPVNAIKNNDTYHVFIMLVDSVESGKIIKEKEPYVETWPKEFETREKIIQNLTNDEKLFLESAFPFYEMLIKESTKSIVDGKDYSITSDLFKSQYDKIKSLTDLKKEELKTMQTHLQNAHDELMNYFSNPSDDAWYKAQSELMNFISSYYQL